MPKPWSEVRESAAFQSLPSEQQETARLQYFNDVVAPRVPQADVQTARSQFDQATQAQPSPYGKLGAGVMGALSGAAQTILGVQQLMGLDRPDRPTELGGALRDVEALLQDPRISTAATTGRVLGTVADPLGVAIPPLRGGGLARTAQGIATGAAFGGAQPVPEGGSRAEQAIAGGVGGGLVGGAVEAGRAGLRGIQQALPAERAGEVRALGEQFDVPTTLGEETGAPILQRAEVAAEAVPGVGLTGPRLRQNVAAREAATNLVERLDVGVNTTDLGEAVHTSLTRQSRSLRERAGVKYSRVAELADARGPVPSANMVSRAQEALAEQTSLAPQHQNDALVGELQKYAEDPGYTFTQLRQLRTNISDVIDGYLTGQNAIVGKRGVASLIAVKEAMNDDMAIFAQKEGGELFRRWKQADGFYRQRVVPFRDRALTRVAAKNEMDTIFTDIISKRGGRDRARKFYNALDQEGRAATRAWIANEALDNATNEAGLFSPAQFARSIRQKEKAIGVFFKGKQRREIDGFVNLMQYIKRAGQVAENPPTGARIFQQGVGPVGVIGGLAVAPEATITALGGVGLFRLLTTTERGKGLMLAASRMDPASPGMARIMELVNQQAPRVAGVGAAELTNP